MKRKFYLTTPLYYVNGDPHVGHVYTTVIADALARYRRLCGQDVCFLTGTDEHGLKIERSAQAEGVSPQELTDRYAGRFREVWQHLDVGFDEFIRTTESRHAVAVAELARRIGEKGFIYPGEYSGQYCVNCEAYVAEDQQTCPDCGRPTEFLTEKSYFFKLSAFQEKLLEFYRSNPRFVLPQTRMNEIVSFVKGGLNDISISRSSFAWGIPMTEDPEHIFYVWFDALTGYLSGVGFGRDEERFQSCWPAGVQLIGKDILRFHAVYWPAFLMAAGLEPPHHVLVNGWWTVEGEKMSKSKGNFVSAEELTSKLPGDYIRYFLLREISVGSDGDFSYRALVQRVNSDLANDVGNLAGRTLKMIQNYFEGIVPEKGSEEGGDEQLVRFCRETVELYRKNLDALLNGKALENIWELVSAANRYLVANEPWILARDRSRRDRLGSVLYNTSETIRLIAVLLSPIVPAGAGKILEQYGLQVPVKELKLDALKWGVLQPGTTVTGDDPVYPRLDLKDLDSPAEEGVEESEPARNEAEEIGIDEFARVEMRVGRILEAERVPKSDKLLRLQVDMGFERRQVVAGIGSAYDPAQLPGRLVAVVTNLKPVKLMGVESNGMIVAASDEGEPVLATFNEEVALGARLK